MWYDRIVRFALRNAPKEDHQKAPTPASLFEYLKEEELLEEAEIDRYSDEILKIRRQFLEELPLTPANSVNDVNDTGDKEAGLLNGPRTRSTSFSRTVTSISLFRWDTGNYVMLNYRRYEGQKSYIKAKTLEKNDMAMGEGKWAEYQWKRPLKDFQEHEDKSPPQTLLWVVDEEEAERLGMDCDIFFGAEYVLPISEQRASQLVSNSPVQGVEKTCLLSARGGAGQSSAHRQATYNPSSSLPASHTTVYNQSGTFINITLPSVASADGLFAGLGSHAANAAAGHTVFPPPSESSQSDAGLTQSSKRPAATEIDSGGRVPKRANLSSDA